MRSPLARISERAHAITEALLKPREPMFEGDLAYAFLLGTALLYTGDAAEGQKYAERVFGAGESGTPGIVDAHQRPANDAAALANLRERIGIELEPGLHGGVKMIDAENAGELISLLRNEAKVL